MAQGTGSCLTGEEQTAFDVFYSVKAVLLLTHICWASCFTGVSLHQCIFILSPSEGVCPKETYLARPAWVSAVREAEPPCRVHGLHKATERASAGQARGQAAKCFSSLGVEKYLIFLLILLIYKLEIRVIVISRCHQ